MSGENLTSRRPRIASNSNYGSSVIDTPKATQFRAALGADTDVVCEERPREVTRTLRYSMFLPSIKDGRAVSDFASLLLKF